MRWCIRSVKPQAVIHLGDYFADGEAMAEENPGISFYQVPGNCDLHRMFIPVPEICSEKVCGVQLYITHGHRHNVKLTLSRLLADARAGKAQAVLFGHTHEALCQQEQDGLWVLNPGACGSSGGSAGLMEVEGGKILNCSILRQEDLEL